MDLTYKFPVFCLLSLFLPNSQRLIEMFNKPQLPEISVQELKAAMDADDRPVLLDVRQIPEHEQGNIGGQLIQLDQLPSRVNEIEDLKDTKIVVYCRSGGRSGRAVEFLQANGFTGATNLRGGMLAWSAEIDPSLSV